MGRRPIILFGQLGSMTASVLFGLATAYPYAVMARSLSGLLNGSVGVSKTYLGEICDSSNVARIFSFIGLMWGFGAIAGSVFGGLLARPAIQYPKLFSPTGIWGRHPYLIPNLLAAVITLIGFVLCYFFLTENERKKHAPSAKEVQLQENLGLKEMQRSSSDDLNNEVELETLSPSPHVSYDDMHTNGTYGRLSSEITLNDDDGVMENGRDSVDGLVALDGNEDEESRYEKRRTSFEPFRSVATIPNHNLPWYRRGIMAHIVGLPSKIRALPIFQEWTPVLTCIVYACFGALQTMADEIWPLWALTPVSEGGLAFKTNLIGICNAWAGGVQLVFNLVLYPHMAKRFGLVQTFWIGALSSAAIYTLYPTIALVPLPATGNVWSYIRFWAFLGTVALLKQCAAQTGFSSVMTMISNSVYPETMGSANGLGQSLVAFTRMLAPFTSAAMLAMSLSHSMPWPFNRGRLAWWLVSVGCLAVFALAYTVPSSINKPRIEAEEDKTQALHANKTDLATVTSSDNLLSEMRSESSSDDDSMHTDS